MIYDLRSSENHEREDSRDLVPSLPFMSGRFAARLSQSWAELLVALAFIFSTGLSTDARRIEIKQDQKDHFHYCSQECAGVGPYLRLNFDPDFGTFFPRFWHSRHWNTLDIFPDPEASGWFIVRQLDARP